MFGGDPNGYRQDVGGCMDNQGGKSGMKECISKARGTDDTTQKWLFQSQLHIAGSFTRTVLCSPRLLQFSLSMDF